MGVPQLRSVFADVFGEPTASNNAAWLRRKLAEAPDAQVGRGRSAHVRARDMGAAIWNSPQQVGLDLCACCARWSLLHMPSCGLGEAMVGGGGGGWQSGPLVTLPRFGPASPHPTNAAHDAGTAPVDPTSAPPSPPLLSPQPDRHLPALDLAGVDSHRSQACDTPCDSSEDGTGLRRGRRAPKRSVSCFAGSAADKACDVFGRRESNGGWRRLGGAFCFQRRAFAPTARLQSCVRRPPNHPPTCAPASTHPPLLPLRRPHCAELGHL